MNNKCIYILLFGLLCSKPITSIISSYDNGLPKVIHTYDLKRNELQLTEQQHFYENGTLKAKGLLATCIQHEVDHLDGILFIDYLSKLKKDMIIKKLVKHKKEIERIVV